MSNSKKNRPNILKQGIRDAVMNRDTITMKANESKRMTAQEVASVFAPDEIEMLRQNYMCLQQAPRELEVKINEEVIGQEEAVRIVTYVVYYNQKINFLEEAEGDQRKRINLLLIGPTGSGKGSICNALKHNIDVPVVRYTADSITSAGYIGGKVENILLRLFMEAKEDLALAERSIIFIDEIDKKREQIEKSGGRDINGRAVQEELLKFLEPGIVDLTLPSKKVVPFDTSRLTIVLMGAFEGIDEIKKNRFVKKKLGFRGMGEDISEEELQKIPYNDEDLLEYGFIPEFVGRINLIGMLRKLKQEDILKIIFQGKNSLYVEKTRFLADVLNVEQQISMALLESIAKELSESKTGARELESKIENLFYPIIYEAMNHMGEYGICFIDDEGHYLLEYDSVTYYG